MNRTKKSVLIAITSSFNNMLNSIIGLLLTSLIIKIYGSDFNGLTSTSSQLINMLMIVEGGFTTAINVALFVPYVNNDVLQISCIRNTAERKFHRIGITFFLIGILAASVYAIFVKTSYSYLYVLSVFLLVLFPAFLNIFLALKWKILFQMEQNDYIINLISALFSIISLVVNISIVMNNGFALSTRIVIMICSTLNTFLVCVLGRYRYAKYNIIHEKKILKIKGVNDVFILNLTGVIYSSFPILFIAVAVGTEMASVYAIYNGIFLIIKSIVYSIVKAPTIGIGQVINENISKAKKIFDGYQFISFFLITLFLSITASAAMPFVSLLTKGSSDIQYHNKIILILLSATFLFESIHIPSGQMIIMSEKYKVCKRIQLIALIIIILFSVIGNYCIGVFGVLTTVLISAIYLCIKEVTYNYKYILKSSLFTFIKLFLTSTLILFVNIFINKLFISQFENYIMFIFNCALIGIIDFAVCLAIYTVFFKKQVVDVAKRVKNMLLGFHNNK